MGKLITIIPLPDISEVRIETASPITKRRTKIDKKTAKKCNDFIEVNIESKKGTIEEDELCAIKPDLDINSLQDYKEELVFDKIIRKLIKSNDILAHKYGFINLGLSEEEKEFIRNNNSNKKDYLDTTELEEENRILLQENRALKAILEEDNIKDNEDEIKLIA